MNLEGSVNKMKMNAVMYGAGNIGRGFIGQKFYLSGYDTTFIDVNVEMVDRLNADGKYPIFITDTDDYVIEWVENISAVNGRDTAAAVSAIAKCDIMATALGVNILPLVAPVIADAIVKRASLGARPLNILICENLIGSDEYLRDLVKPHIPDYLTDYFENMIGFVCVSVGRTVPKTPEQFLEKYPTAVCAEPYSELPVSLEGFRPIGCEMPPINGLVPFSPFEFFIERKLLIHNMGHALMAYLANLKGYNFIYEAACDAEIKYVLFRALIESATALAERHGAPLDKTIEFVVELMPRFENKLLVDTPLRVGKDTKRKLSEGDRLVGAFNCVRERGKTPAHIAVGIAAGYLFDLPEDPTSVETAAYAREHGIAAALEKYSSITDPADVELISRFYDLLALGAPFSVISEELTKAINKK